MMQSLGLHTNDRMVSSSYVWSPDLHAVEFGSAGDHADGTEPSYGIPEKAFFRHPFTVLASSPS
jgi:3,4-dihydroxy-9,10-secoandrosta-1,3,5(10)-triene-9,17-dione 4,5-dioxygenase